MKLTVGNKPYTVYFKGGIGQINRVTKRGRRVGLNRDVVVCDIVEDDTKASVARGYTFRNPIDAYDRALAFYIALRRATSKAFPDKRVQSVFYEEFRKRYAALIEKSPALGKVKNGENTHPHQSTQG